MYEPYMTLAEIEAKYPNQWVLIDRPQSDRYGNLLGGYVAASAADRDELFRLTEELPLSNHIATIHTGVRPFTVVRDASATLPNTLFKCFVLLVLVGGGAWIAHRLSILAEVPTGVRTYRSCSDALARHAGAVREGRLQPEPDPNNIRRYPLSEELRRAGIVLCIVEHGLIWYWLPISSIDGGKPCLVTPLDRTVPVALFPNRVPFGTYEFRTLPDNWAYWFAATG
jgi:hypothetical protein